MKTLQLLKSAVAALLALISVAVAAGTLSQLPLSLKSGVPPNIMFALSVEFPTAITPAYQDASGYSRGNVYLGYFDPDKCYSYNASLVAGNSGYFTPAYMAGSTDGSTFHWPAAASDVQHACVGLGIWSGNFLNWASMAGLDEFRYAMTGGNRYIDLPDSASNPGGLTVLERSYQTSQGSNFINKTYTDDGYTTGFGSGASMTLINKGQGVQMSVTLGGIPPDTATCTTAGGAHGCDGVGAFTLTNSGGAATCTAWSGSGTTASPYKCTAMTSALTIASLTAGTVATMPTGVVQAGTVTSSCSGFYSSNPSCTMTLSDGSTGACASGGWVGTGSSAAPYTCVAFNSFSGGEVFSVTSPTTSVACTTNCSSFTASQLAPYNNQNVACSINTSNGVGTKATTTCSGLDGNGTTATCSGSAYAGTGSSSNPYHCSTFAISPPSSDSFGGTANADTTTRTKYSKSGSSSYYYTGYTSIVNNVPQPPAPVYYATSYSGNYGTMGISYASSYSVTFGSSAIYNVRVQVCSTSPGVESDCQLYGDNKTWKPTGVLQGYGNSMRFGVTSYFDANDVDNAVLRAKAKYLAPQQYLTAGTYTPNARAEWSAADGTLVSNPDASDAATMSTPWGTAPANSGVINYINKFGSTDKKYKTYDDIGKLYYETLRYLRGGQGFGSSPLPTADFYHGATSSNSDGFPVITQWDDPILYSCQKNYIITMGDAHTWCDKRLPGGSYTSNGNGVCNAYTDSNGNSHPSDMGSLGGDSGIAGTLNGASIGAATGVTDATNAVGQMEGMGNIATTMTGAAGASYYMAGLAAWAATNNIRPDKAPSTSPMLVKSFIIDVQEGQDCAYDKQFWLTAKYGDPSYYASSGTWDVAAPWYNSIPGNSITCSYAYGSPPPNYGSTTANMQWPKNLLRAGDPLSMINSVKSAIQSIAAEQGDEAALAQSAGTLNTGTGAYIYQALYNSGGWVGDLQAYVIDQSGSIGTVPDWAASHQLPVPSARNIYSFNRTSNAGIPFDLDASSGLSNFDTYEQGFLNKSSLGIVDSLGVDRVKYIRGDMSNEAYLPSTTGGTTVNTQTNHGWRSRLAEGSACNYSVTPYTCANTASYTAGPTGQLGDVIYSNPLYVGPPAEAISDASYKVFAQGLAGRKPMVYVGGNDGMLHAYDAAYYLTSSGLPSHCPAASGTQPASCVQGTTTLVSGTEVFGYVPYAAYPTLSKLMSPTYAHTFYADGSPVSADVCEANGGTNAYCDGTNDKWLTLLVGGLNAGGQGIYALDITDPVASFSASNVLWEFTNLDDPDMGYSFSTPIIRKLNNKHWAVIFGNGFNSSDPASNPGNNNAYLFVLYVDPHLSSTQQWVAGTNYFKIPLTSPGLPNNASNGLASIASVDVNHDGTVDYVYGGDRNGNMWKVDLSSSDPTQWKAAFSGTPLFTATDGAGHMQQITTAPKVANHPDGGFMIDFGTGSWIDLTDPNPQNGSLFYIDTLYGIWDQNNGATSSPATGRSVLQRQALLGTYSVDSNGNACTAGSANCTTYTIQSTCEPNYTTTPMASPGNVTTTCPANVPNLTPAVALASPVNTGQQYGWFFDLPGNGERSHSDPPALTGTTIQFTSLTPSTDPCTGNTKGFEYNLSYLTGAAPSTGIFVVPGTATINISGYIYWTPPGATSPIKVVASGQSIVGGAALNPVTFNATPPGSIATAAAGMPSTMPTPCTTGNCSPSVNNYIPGFGFLMNLNSGPSSASGKWVLSCYPQQSGGAAKNCQWRHRTGQFGRLMWKQVY